MPPVKGKKGFQTTPEAEAFRSDSNVKIWLESLYHGSRMEYEVGLRRLCRILGVTATQLKDEAEADPKALSLRIKVALRQEQEKGNNNTPKLKSVLVNYLALFDISLPLMGLKFKRKKPVPHPLLSWDEASRIISLADSAYQPVFKLMQWGIDAERFVWLNNDKATLDDIKKQLENPEKDFIKITVPQGRHGQVSSFYVLVPREVASYLPIRMARKQDGKNEPVGNKSTLWHQWRVALERAGLPIDRKHGAHNLRSCWKTEATKRGLEEVLRQHQLGHDIDPQNYQRINQDERFVVEQFRKAWQMKEAATKEELQTRNKEIDALREILGATLNEQQLNIQDKILLALKAAGLPTTTPVSQYPPELKEMQNELNKIQERLMKLGLVKPADIYG